MLARQINNKYRRRDRKMDNYKFVLDKILELKARSQHSATNVTEYMGPSLRMISEVTGQRTKYSGFNWDTRVSSRSAKYTVSVGSKKVMPDRSTLRQE